ncbi:uncharacterized protein N7498_010740 [Penicillium cinerascens]|uniref:HNH nuclease domain-containing protein n=1 Tax=Penicillium cinerascens TaxID=70096 RepID=A0A9W9M751_9EURO|nr:uncharacterized protein N7498_010740 [Penicillium cinerascens]KAJ5191755.1 hypothetical protein N7498_010740 [Penicillium cinerascens]
MDLQDPSVLTHNATYTWEPNQTNHLHHANTALQVTPGQTHLTCEMLYRYCSMIFIIPNHRRWALFPLRQNGSTSRHMLRGDSPNPVHPGNYIVLDYQYQGPITVQLTSECAPRRVTTQDQSDRSQGRSERELLQSRLRSSVCARDTVCAITNNGPAYPDPNKPYEGLEACHIFPTSQLAEWNRNNYRRYITDTSPANQIGQSGLYSPQNALLLSPEEHRAFDQFKLGVDPDDGYKIIVFGPDPKKTGGKRLRRSARCGTNPNDRVSADLLRWHLRMCVYRNMKANAEPRSLWKEDLGSDDIGQILEQPDAAERMEVELFTRLGELVA